MLESRNKVAHYIDEEMLARRTHTPFKNTYLLMLTTALRRNNKQTNAMTPDIKRKNSHARSRIIVLRLHHATLLNSCVILLARELDEMKAPWLRLTLALLQLCALQIEAFVVVRDNPFSLTAKRAVHLYAQPHHRKMDRPTRKKKKKKNYPRPMPA